MSIAIPFTIMKTWKPCNCPKIEEYLNMHTHDRGVQQLRLYFAESNDMGRMLISIILNKISEYKEIV